jgi:hypothetical protein
MDRRGARHPPLQNDLLYNLLPKRVLSEGAQADIRAALTALGVPKVG